MLNTGEMYNNGPNACDFSCTFSLLKPQLSVSPIVQNKGISEKLDCEVYHLQPRYTWKMGVVECNLGEVRYRCGTFSMEIIYFYDHILSHSIEIIGLSSDLVSKLNFV